MEKSLASNNQRDITNKLTNQIVDYCLEVGCFAWRENTVGVPIVKDSAVIGFRPQGIVGKPDIFIFFPSTANFIGMEVKTGKDRPSEKQLAFRENIRAVGGNVYFVGNLDIAKVIINCYLELYEKQTDP